MTRTVIKAALATCLALGFSVAALALSVDQSKNVVVRNFGEQELHFYRWTMNYNDPNISGTTGGQKFGAMLRNTFINSIACHVATAFNGTTPQMNKRRRANVGYTQR